MPGRLAIFVSKRLSVVAAAVLCLMAARLVGAILHGADAPQRPAVTSVRLSLVSQTVR
jgi:hypothetical protein